MCKNYHPKIYKKNSGQWGCCMSTDSEREGCRPATSSMRFLLAYKEQLTPSQAMEMSLATRPIHGRQSCPVKIRPDGLHSKKGETDSPCVPTHNLTSGDSPSDGSFQNSKRTDSGIYSLEDRMLPNLGEHDYWNSCTYFVMVCKLTEQKGWHMGYKASFFSAKLL